MTKQLVVARYSESLDWLQQINSEYQINVYNKGNAINNSFTTNLENIGREAHTYLKYIVDNYDNLAETIVFCQGNPFPHCQNFIEQINLTKIDSFQWLANSLFDSDPFGKPHHHLHVDIKSFLQVALPDIEVPANFKFGPGAQFIVTKETILSKPKEVYEKMLSLFTEEQYNDAYKQNDLVDGRPIDWFYHFACILERAWELLLLYNCPPTIRT
jgi:hypothetical protein